ALGVFAIGFTVWFFRDPVRTPPEGASGLILSPADGKVIEIVEEEEPIYLNGPGRRLSIFLSPLNVHVNRIPIDGVVEHEAYHPGAYLVAWHPKASTENERSEVGMRHPSGVRVLFKQIAGKVARRIVCHAEVGDEYRAGDRYGIVRFGSRMDVIVPPEVAFTAEIGDRVVGGETVIGKLPSGAPRAETTAPAAAGVAE
ncbi:MAG: phosphatidylserine decarboxylase family protein, partial [Rhodothermales bacterium]|nr:phosphatidylserine decarboxylase family protein [Rhodothermales bacterium]